MVYSDSHAHLIDYSPEQLKKVLALMRKKQVEFALAVGVNLDSSEGTIKLAETYHEIKAAVGIHPWFASKLDADMRKRFEKLASSKYVRALGEIGLDYAPPTGKQPGGPPPDMPKMEFPDKMPPLPKTPPSPEVQKEVFNFEVSIAKKYGLPLNIHCMGGAHQDMMKILNANPGLRGIAHGFNGDLKMLKDWLDLGFYIAPALMNLTPELEEVIRAIPLDKLVTETDANPMLSPDGPADVIQAAQKIADIRGVPVEEIGNMATANLKRLLKP
jgi:TatD DNase family protein